MASRQPERPAIRTAPQFGPAVAAAAPESLLTPPAPPPAQGPLADEPSGELELGERRRRRDPVKLTIYVDQAIADRVDDLTLRWQRKYRRQGRVEKGLIQDALLVVALQHLAEVEQQLKGML